MGVLDVGLSTSRLRKDVFIFMSFVFWYATRHAADSRP